MENDSITDYVYWKAFDVITSCNEPIHCEVASQYLRQFAIVYGVSDEWRSLVAYLEKKCNKISE
jgi:hypothetical protein